MQGSSFKDYLKQVEGIDGKAGDRYYPYTDIAGISTIGFGHKVRKGEDFSRGLSEFEVEALLDRDIKRHEKRLRRKLSPNVYDKLDQEQKEMLLDFEFNVGISKFPRFTRAVLLRDWDTAKQEHIRYVSVDGIKVPIGRNRIFYDRYLKDL